MEELNKADDPRFRWALERRMQRMQIDGTVEGGAAASSGSSVEERKRGRAEADEVERVQTKAKQVAEAAEGNAADAMEYDDDSEWEQAVEEEQADRREKRHASKQNPLEPSDKKARLGVACGLRRALEELQICACCRDIQGPRVTEGANKFLLQSGAAMNLTTGWDFKTACVELY